MIGIAIDPDELKHNIHVRLLERLEAGMIEEVQQLLAAGVTPERLEDLGLEYRYLSRYLSEQLDYDTMCTELETKIRQFAKRQLTWLKRDQTITWFSPTDHDAVMHHISNFLATS